MYLHRDSADINKTSLMKPEDRARHLLTIVSKSVLGDEVGRVLHLELAAKRPRSSPQVVYSECHEARARGV